MERITDERELDWLVSREIPTPPSEEWLRQAEEMAALIGELTDQPVHESVSGPALASFLGIDPQGWEASAWIMHAMWETVALPGGLTHDDVHRIERGPGTGDERRASMTPDELRVEDAVEEVLGDATFVNTSYRDAPGPEWRRLRWSELRRRLGLDTTQLDGYPSFLWSPYESWPANLTGQGEGSLDREQLECLVAHFVAVSPRGGETTCFAFYGACAAGDYDRDVLHRGFLRDIPSLLDVEELSGSPSNFWPEDRAWLVYTDWDLWGTKVSGNATLIERLANDPRLDIIQVSSMPGEA
jgi:hypothetical protein